MPEIDGLRAMAVLAVLAIHVTSGRVTGGFLGVNLFFVLSGFLITYLLIEEHKASERIDFCAFYLRRALRILPPLCAAIVLAYTLWPSGPPFAPTLAPVLLFYANLVEGGSLNTLTPTWSLAVEEQFYILWPVILALCAPPRGVPKWLTPRLVSIAAIVLCAMFVLVRREPFFFMTAGFSATAILSAVLVAHGVGQARSGAARRAGFARRGLSWTPIMPIIWNLSLSFSHFRRAGTIA